MRKVIMLNRISVDGLFSGPRGESHEWFVDDPKVTQAAHEMMDPDTLLLGRITYQQFERVWPKIGADPKSPDAQRRIAKELDTMNKVVFSKTLDHVTWKNSRLVKDNPAGEVRRIKAGSGRDITIFGSGSIVQQLANERLIDEFLIVVTPIVLGLGKPLFKEVKQLGLELIADHRFKSGNLMLHYRASAWPRSTNRSAAT